MADHTQMKLGKGAARKDARTLLLENYFTPDIPMPPDSADQSHGINPEQWEMLGNDKIGDCTVAAALHQELAWNGPMSKVSPACLVSPTVDYYDVLEAYEVLSGYDSDTGANDNGAVVLDVLNYWRKTGIAGRKITAYAAVGPQDAQRIRQAVSLFGGCYLGLQLPLIAAGQALWSSIPGPEAAGHPSDADPGSWGGHAVVAVGYTDSFVQVVTWGAIKPMTWGFLSRYCDEAYAILSPDWRPPAGIDQAKLLADLSAITAAGSAQS
jgi:hypothetical protein